VPPSLTPDGPQGHFRAELAMALHRKASGMTESTCGDVFVSDLHRDVSACLTHLGIEHENGVMCGTMLLDIVAVDMINPSKRIVYEVNSPHHYYEGTQTLLAEMRLRHRILNRLGQKLHHVDAAEWIKLSPAQRMNHILKLQQEQQESNSVEAQQQAAANALRAPPTLPGLKLEISSNKLPSPSEPLKLKCASKLNAPIKVPVPPSRQKLAV